QHPHDTVLAIDARGRVCGASSSMISLLDAPQQILGQSLLRVPQLQVEGFRPLVEQEEVRPYPVHVALPQKELQLKADAIPIQGERQSVGTILILPHRRAPRPSVQKEPRSSWTASYTFSDLIGNSIAMRQCVVLAQRAATQNFPVLLLGESGTGKELLAQ